MPSKFIAKKMKRKKQNGRKILKNALVKRGDGKLSKKCIAATKKAIKKSKGLLTHASDYLGLTLSAMQLRIEKYPEIYEMYVEQMERNLDDIERNLMDAADERYPWAIKYYMDSKAKKRGYGAQRIEHTGVNGTPLPSAISQEDIAKLSVDEIRQLVDIITKAKQPPVLEANYKVEPQP